uniref:Venom protein n=1 Tax=Ampulex compressa TaxID=860918 RepID=A0A1W6EW13_AMPCP|nr:venom protein [Ampulex compressa]
MKRILILCIYIAFCRLSTSNADDTQVVQRLKVYGNFIDKVQNNIQNKIKRLGGPNILKLFTAQFVWSITHQIALIELESKTSKALNDTLIYIDPIVTKARKLQDCYDEEQKALKNLTSRAEIVYYDCNIVATAYLLTPSGETADVTKHGKDIIEKLQNLYSQCTYLSSSLLQEPCIRTVLRQTKPLVKEFEEKYKIAHQVHAKKYQRIDNFGECYEKQILPLNQEIQKIRKAASKCIEETELRFEGRLTTTWLRDSQSGMFSTP